MNSAGFTSRAFFTLSRGAQQLGACGKFVRVALFLGSGLLAHAQPVITDFSPKAGTPGDTIQVIGVGFSVGTVTVYFWNGVPAFTRVVSDTMLTATVPVGATTGVLGIQNYLGRTSTSADFTVVGRGPYITDVFPAYGDSSTTVTISGVHLTNVAPNGVKFNGVASTDASPNASGTIISVHVPPGAPPGSNPLVVTSTYGTSNSPTAFTVLGPGPYVATFSPDSGTPNTKVSIMGMHFTGVTNVSFNGAAGTGLYYSDTLITVWTPTNLTTGKITVSSPSGNFTTAEMFYAPPTLTGISPSSGRAGTNVTLTGTNLRGTTNVSFNGKSAAFTVVNNTAIQAIVPSACTSGFIQVRTPDFSCTNSTRFSVPPTIYGFAPVSGRPGTNVLITGANFNVGTPSVWFNGVKAQTVTGVSFGQLTAVVPAGATTTGPISLSTADGGDTNMNLFYLPASITGFAPSIGGPGTPVTITGVNFLDTSSLSFNGVPAFFGVSSNLSITAYVPNNASSGPITLTTPAGAVTSSGFFYAAPRISSFSPTLGFPGTNVTIIGTNFLGATAVRFNGAAAAFTYVNSGKLVAVAPPGVKTGPITVEAPGGTNTTLTSFTVDYKSDLETWMTDAPDPVTATSNLVYSTTVINHGPFDAPNVRLTNTLPSSVKLLSATMPWPWVLATNGNQLAASIDNMAVGGASTLTVTVAPQNPGTIVAGAVVASDNVDPGPYPNNVAITTTVLPLPLLFIDWWTNQVKVSWHVALSNFVLESTIGSAANGTWSAVTNIPVVSGTRQSVIQSNTAPGKFYRLKK